MELDISDPETWWNTIGQRKVIEMMKKTLTACLRHDKINRMVENAAKGHLNIIEAKKLDFSKNCDQIIQAKKDNFARIAFDLLTNQGIYKALKTEIKQDITADQQASKAEVDVSVIELRKQMEEIALLAKQMEEFKRRFYRMKMWLMGCSVTLTFGPLLYWIYFRMLTKPNP